MAEECKIVVERSDAKAVVERFDAETSSRGAANAPPKEKCQPGDTTDSNKVFASIAGELEVLRKSKEGKVLPSKTPRFWQGYPARLDVNVKSDEAGFAGRYTLYDELFNINGRPVYFMEGEPELCPADMVPLEPQSSMQYCFPTTWMYYFQNRWRILKEPVLQMLGTPRTEVDLIEEAFWDVADAPFQSEEIDGELAPNKAKWTSSVQVTVPASKKAPEDPKGKRSLWGSLIADLGKKAFPKRNPGLATDSPANLLQLQSSGRGSAQAAVSGPKRDEDEAGMHFSLKLLRACIV